jgi:TM2 domain-containing membrane protein YozV
MHPVKAVAAWADDPERLRTFHGWATLAWAGIGVPLTLLWPHSVMWVALMSVWANVVGHWGAWQASRSEVNDITD